MRGTTRISPSRRRTWRSSASTTGSSTVCPLRCRLRNGLHGPGRGSSSTTSGCSATTTCPDLRRQRRPRRLPERTQDLRGRRGPDGLPDDADRVLRSRLPSRAQHGARRVQLEQALRLRQRHARDCSSTSRAEGGFVGGPRLPSNWLVDYRRLFDFKEAGRQNLAVPAAQFNRAMRIDSNLVRPLRTIPPPSPPRDQESRASQPGPGADAEARERTADGQASSETRGSQWTR